MPPFVSGNHAARERIAANVYATAAAERTRQRKRAAMNRDTFVAFIDRFRAARDTLFRKGARENDAPSTVRVLLSMTPPRRGGFLTWFRFARPTRTFERTPIAQSTNAIRSIRVCRCPPDKRSL
jgi:hypothetical protein